MSIDLSAGLIIPRQTCLMLGAGHAKPERRLIASNSVPEEETRWVTLDICKDANPDIVFDLGLTETGDECGKIPVDDESFDEIHAYEVLEHFGTQGNYRGFFASFREFHRILKPGGVFMATVPAIDSPWLWGDPGHTRAITSGTIVFLTKDHYDQLGVTMSTDYRSHIDPCWWNVEHAEHVGGHFVFALRKA